MTSSDNIIKVTAGLIAAIPFYAEIDNLRDIQRQDLRLRIKYPDQNVHLVVPRLRDLKRVVTEADEDGKFDNNNFLNDKVSNFIEVSYLSDFVAAQNWRLRTNLLLSHGVWTEASQIDISLCLSVRPGHELELCKPVKVMFAPKPVKRGI